MILVNFHVPGVMKIDWRKLKCLIFVNSFEVQLHLSQISIRKTDETMKNKTLHFSLGAGTRNIEKTNNFSSLKFP